MLAPLSGELVISCTISKFLVGTIQSIKGFYLISSIRAHWTGFFIETASLTLCVQWENSYAFILVQRMTLDCGALILPYGVSKRQKKKAGENTLNMLIMFGGLTKSIKQYSANK